MASANLLNYTTTVPANRTISQMQDALGRAGARRVVVEYLDGSPAGLAFTLMTPHGERGYTLPVDTDAVQRVLAAQRKGNSRVKADIAQAERVAWRILKDWLEAQLAIVATQMANLDQVMLPYLHVDGELTMYAKWQEHEAKALEA